MGKQVKKRLVKEFDENRDFINQNLDVWDKFLSAQHANQDFVEFATS